LDVATPASTRNRILPAVAPRLSKRVDDKALTAREFVMRDLTSAESNEEIGNALNISEAERQGTHQHILEKLRLRGAPKPST